MLKAVIFDMDGVLIDSESCWQQAQVRLLAEPGVTITAKDCLQTMGLRIEQLASLEQFRLGELGLVRRQQQSAGTIPAL